MLFLVVLNVALLLGVIALLLWPEPEVTVSGDAVEEAEGMKKFWLVWPLGAEEGAKNVHEYEQYACEEAERRAALLSEPVAVLEAVQAYGRPVQELDLED
jgi:hypothetical protein